MIFRIVRLKFQPEKCASFEKAFSEKRQRVVGFSGCHSLKLLKETTNPTVFYTFSCWENEAALDSYRTSEVFRDLWSTIKPWFAEKAQAWSMNGIYEGENSPAGIKEIYFNQ
ncbi:MAG: antibiotic biosynthesis monooxygenase [Flavobacteriia bacterium]|nr:antibiotic biosynthesis monooxygenase [Flavobacteriia bacterium]